MATSGKIQGKTYNSSGTDVTSRYGTWIEWKRNSSNVTNNTSNITVTVYVQRIDSYAGETAWDLTAKPSVNLKVGGVAKSPTIYYIDTRNHKLCTVATWTGNVSHSADGTLTLALSCDWTLGLASLYRGSISDNATLDTIPRASAITVSNSSVTMGNTINITISPADSSFKHKIRYEFGDAKSQIDGVKVGGTQITADFIPSGAITFTPSTDLGKQIPSANSGTCMLSLYTYTSGGTHIGTKTINITFNVPSYTPTISNIALTGNGLLSGAYVQGKSTVTAEITASTMYGATIKSYSATVDGKTYTGNKFTSSALSNGSKTVSVTVTDTRGKTATLNSSAFTVYAYANPIITEFSFERQADETTVIATVKGTISAINNKNAKTITVTLNGVTQTITSSSYTINGTTTFTNVPTDNTLTAIAKLTDSYTSVSKDAVLPTVAVTEDYHYSGKGKALGKVAETEGLFEVDWTSKFNKAVNINTPTFESLSITRTDSGNGATVKFVNKNGALGYIGMTNNANEGLRRWTYDTASSYIVLDTGNTKDYIVEQGTSGVWTYRKWNSGLAECWGTYGESIAISKTWGSMYYSDSLTPRINYPLTFTSRPIENVTFRGNSVAGWLYCEGGGYSLNTTTQTAQYGVCRPTSIGAATLTFDYYVVGRWK